MGVLTKGTYILVQKTDPPRKDRLPLFSFPAYTQLNTHYHPFPNYCTLYDIIIGSPCILLRIYMPPPRRGK